MSAVTFGSKTYEVDSEGFLLDATQWDEGFARGMAPTVGLPAGLGEKQWKLIHSIRRFFKEEGRCPPVYETCRMNGVHLGDLSALFPTGYLRGACKLAGVTYKEGYVSHSHELARESVLPLPEKKYEVDVRGFLVSPDEWDEQFAVYKAYEMKMPGPLKEEHWRIIHFLRSKYKENKLVPTVYETCRDNNMGIEELERLFPDGYHRGAVKLAGLRVR